VFAVVVAKRLFTPLRRVWPPESRLGAVSRPVAVAIEVVREQVLIEERIAIVGMLPSMLR
jgi:hypothetical protein